MCMHPRFLVVMGLLVYQLERTNIDGTGALLYYFFVFLLNGKRADRKSVV